MKKASVTVLVILVCMAAKAQSAFALFKPTYGGDEHYGFSSAKTVQAAKDSAFKQLSLALTKYGATNTVGKQFIAASSDKKGWCVIGRGKDQYKHNWHYEAVLGYAYEEDVAKTLVLSSLRGRGLSNVEIMYCHRD